MSKAKAAPAPQPRKLRVTCWSWNEDPNGTRRTLAEFEDGHAVLDQQTAQSKAMDWVDDLLEATKKFSLYTALNDIQAECNLDRDPKPFPDKTKMPLCIVNLVLKEHGLELEEG